MRPPAFGAGLTPFAQGDAAQGDAAPGDSAPATPKPRGRTGQPRAQQPGSKQPDRKQPGPRQPGAAPRGPQARGAAPRARASKPLGVTGAANGSGSTNWLRSIRFSGFTVLMLVVLVLFVVVVAPGARVFLDQRQQIADLQSQVQQAQATNAELNADVARWSDPAYVRALARDRLYFVMPGETSFLILNDTATTGGAAAAPVSTSIQPTDTNWLASLFASGMTAGLSNQTPDQLGASNGTVK